MDQALLTPLNQLENSLNALLTSLTTTNTYTAAPAAAQSLVNADDALSSALTQLRQHQANYSRILTLRAEANRLQTRLRDTVRTCIELRSEIGQIHPSILAETDEEDDDDYDTVLPAVAAATNALNRNPKPIPYSDLLSFAARIGKHNAAAAIEAERQSNRRHIEASTSQLTGTVAGQEANGNAPVATTTPTNPPSSRSQIPDPTAVNSITATQESQAELAAINDTLAQQRAYRGMAFPAAEALRMGELGRLQYIREQDGEEAVEKEVEKMIRESERVSVLEKTERDIDGEGEVVVSSRTEVGSALPERASVYSSSAGAVSSTNAASQRPAQGQVALPPKPKMVLDLDFPDSDEDDDD